MNALERKNLHGLLADTGALLTELQRRSFPVSGLPRPEEFVAVPSTPQPAATVVLAPEVKKVTPPPRPAPAVDPGRFPVPPPGMEELFRAAHSCTACKLAATRQNVAFGDGSGENGLMLIGEGPGQHEDETGVPFVGRAGKLLDQMIIAAGFSRGGLYITNVVKCRPPGNRDPEKDEIRACRPLLDGQIKAMKPALIVAIGRPSALSLLETDQSLSRLRGRVHSLGGVPLVVTYHPAYLLRSPEKKADAWLDWRLIKDTLAGLAAGTRPLVDGMRIDRVL